MILPTLRDLEAGLVEIGRSPTQQGTLELIVCRPRGGERQILPHGQLDLERGLIGDDWYVRGNPRTPDGRRHPDMQINVINARAIALVAQDKARWPLAGDQLYVDLDLSPDNLPPWTMLAIGEAVIQVTDQPHTGCAKFVARFGVEAMKFVNSPVGRRLNLRGINARVVTPGTIHAGDIVRKAPAISPGSNRQPGARA